MAKKKQRKKAASRAAAGTRVYELEVCLRSGPVTERFAKANPVVSRTIRIRGNRTLQRLHRAIFKAFDRFDEHMYEFQVGGKGPMDPKARRYVLPMALTGPFADEKAAGTVTHTTIEDLGLKVGQAFGYWFDFGDDWWHQIDVLAILTDALPGRYPRVTARTGASPPQYADWEEQDEQDQEE